MTRARRWLTFAAPPLGYAAVIFFFSSLHSVPGPSLYGKDKVLHFSVYAGLAFLTSRALHAYGGAPSRAAVGAVLLASLYGVTDEYHQMFVPGRTAELADLAADALGAMLGSWVWFKKRPWPSAHTGE